MAYYDHHGFNHTCIFQHDIDRYHVVHACIELLNHHHIRIRPWPAWPLDLSANITEREKVHQYLKIHRKKGGRDNGGKTFHCQWIIM